MSTFDTPAQGRPRHRRPAPRWLYLLRLAAVAAAVSVVWGFVATPILAVAIGLPATWGVVLALSFAVLCWRR